MARTKQTARKSTGGRAPRIARVEPESEEEGSSSVEDSDLLERDEESSDDGTVHERRASSEAQEERDEPSEEEALDDHSFQVFPKKVYGKNFDDDLQDCLTDKVDYTGNICYHELLPSAPNPCLNIAGLGSIGVPLSSREAVAVFEQAGKSKNANMRSFPACEVTFDNPDWTRVLRRTISERLWSSLGIAPYFAPARCVLQKLVIFKPGKLNLKSLGDDDDNVFAHLMVQLPSSHAGGKLRISLGSQTGDVDLAESPFTTSILASYRGAKVSFAPISEGYRIGLVYGLVSTGATPDVPAETLMTLKLRHIFQKWKDGRYSNAPPQGQFAYILDQPEASASEVKGQTKQQKDTSSLLDRQDQLVCCIKAVAEEFNYDVFTGQVVYCQSGMSDHGKVRSDWWNWGDDGDLYDYDEDTMTIVRVEETTVKFDEITDANDVDVEGAYLKLTEDDLVPCHFFDNMPPDSRSYEHETGNLDYEYRRSALLVVSEEKREKLLSKASDDYWLSILEDLDPEGPDSLDPKRIDLILSRSSRYGRTSELRLMDLALNWNDLNLWSRAAQKFDDTVEQHKIKNVVEALKVFSFQQMKPILDKLLGNTEVPAERIKFLKALESEPPSQDEEDVTEWITEHYTEILTNGHQVSDMITIGQERGAAFLLTILYPRLRSNPLDIAVIQRLYLQLRQNANTIQDSSVSLQDSADSEMQFSAKDVASLLLERALKRPKYKIYGLNSVQKLSPQSEAFSRLKIVIQLYLSTGKLQDCALPLRLLLHTEPTQYTAYAPMYEQLVGDFRTWLAKRKLAMTASPFKYFFAAAIGLELQHLLDSPRPSGAVNIPPFGCGKCDYCHRIDQYLRKREQPHFYERIYANERRHVEHYLRNFNLATYHIEPAPGYKARIYLTLSKHTFLQPAEVWKSRVVSAKAYLSRIGSDAEIAALMGEEWPKIQESMKGVRAYVPPQRFRDALGDVTRERLEFPPPQAQTAPGAASSNTPGQMVSDPDVANRKKRKSDGSDERLPKRARDVQYVDHGVIELSSSS